MELLFWTGLFKTPGSKTLIAAGVVFLLFPGRRFGHPASFRYTRLALSYRLRPLLQQQELFFVYFLGVGLAIPPPLGIPDLPLATALVPAPPLPENTQRNHVNIMVIFDKQEAARESLLLLKAFLTFMLLAANFANTKLCRKYFNWLKPWQMGTHLKEFSKSFPMNTNMTGFRWFSEIFASLCFGCEHFSR